MQDEHIQYILDTCEPNSHCTLYAEKYQAGVRFHHVDNDLIHDHILPLPESSIQKHGWLTLRNCMVDIFEADHRLWRGEKEWETTSISSVTTSPSSVSTKIKRQRSDALPKPKPKPVPEGQTTFI